MIEFLKLFIGFLLFSWFGAEEWEAFAITGILLVLMEIRGELLNKRD